MLNKFQEELKKHITDYTNFNFSFDEYTNNFISHVIQIWVQLYDNFPYFYYISELTDTRKTSKFAFLGLELSKVLKITTKIENGTIDSKKTLEKLKEAYSDGFGLRCSSEYTIFITEQFIWVNNLLIVSNDDIVPEILKYVVLKEDVEDSQIYLVTKNGYGFSRKSFKLKVNPIDNNYNDDVPFDKLSSILKEDSSSIILLHGEPGTGKTSFIRNIIDLNKNKTFLYLDSSVFSYINSTEFIDFLMDNKDSVCILEDCESLLMSRDSGENTLMTTLLNISDGMLGDVLNLKFICTFNTDLKNIDKAILRKGRLKLKYEFKKLDSSKVKEIFISKGIDPSLAKPMTLADAWNYDTVTGGETKKENKVGFFK